jgi:hypothetical protein
MNNFNADRINYAEVPPTPRQVESLGTPDTPISVQSLPVSLVVARPEPTRRCLYKLMEELEIVDIQAKPKLRKEKENDKD